MIITAPATEHLILNSLVDIPIQILVVEADPIVRSGLLACLHEFPDLQGATAVETRSSALLVLSERIETTTASDLVLFGLSLDPSSRLLSAMLQGSGSANEISNLPLNLANSRLTPRA